MMAEECWDEVEVRYNKLFDPQREWRCEEIIKEYGQQEYRRGYRWGIEAMRDAARQEEADYDGRR